MQSNTSTVVLRPIQIGDIAGAMKLSVGEGWNQTEDDWKLFINSTQNLCVLAESGEEIIGTTTVMNYSNEIAWVGMVLVGKAHRGQGISRSLLENTFKNLRSFKSIKLDATPAGQKVYAGFGFKEEYPIARMVNTSLQNFSFTDDASIMQVQWEDVHGMIALDKPVFGADRSLLINSLIKRFPHKAWVLKRNNIIEGFAFGREGYRYHHVGPVIATGVEDAKALIIKAIKDLFQQPVVVDVLCDKENLVKWLISIGFIEQRRFMRMYKDENPFPGSVDQYYLICGPEFG